MDVKAEGTKNEYYYYIWEPRNLRKVKFAAISFNNPRFVKLFSPWCSTVALNESQPEIP